MIYTGKERLAKERLVKWPVYRGKSSAGPGTQTERVYTPRRLADSESSKVSDVIIQIVLHSIKASVRGPKNSTTNESGSSGDGPGHLDGCFSQLNHPQCIWGTGLLALSVLNTCHSRLLLSQYFRRGRLFC